MSRKGNTSIMGAGLLMLAGCATLPDHAPADYRLDGGLWYADGSFVERSVEIAGARLRFVASDAPAAQVVHLDGQYVIPPFCEGHNHNVGGEIEGAAEVVDAYLAAGVFYAAMPGSFRLYREAIADLLGGPTGLDVRFANNGITGVGGHPRSLRESLKERYGSYPEFSLEGLADVGYFEVDSRAALMAKWPLVLAERPDFIKVMLYFSDEFEQRRTDPDFYGKRGLDPALLPDIVALARQSDLPVAVHVENEFDMRTALLAGADIIAHLPSYDADLRLSKSTIDLAAQTGAALVTTFGLAKREEERDPALYQRILTAQRDTLSRLHEAGARLVVGSDNTRDSSVDEALHLQSLGVLSNAAIIDMWTKNCTDTFFPDRDLGRLDDGAEASFLVLEGDPLGDFAKVRSISRRMKEGEWLEADTPPSGGGESPKTGSGSLIPSRSLTSPAE